MYKIKFEAKIILLILAIFFVPAKHIEIYMIVTITLLVILFPTQRINQKYIILFLCFSVYLTVITLLQGNSYRNLTELIRFLPLLLCSSFFGPKKLYNPDIIIKTLFYLTLIYALISCLQMLYPSSFISDMFAKMYNTSGHYTKSFIGNNRASSLSAGPGQAGAFGALMFSIACATLLHAKQLKQKLSIAVMLSSVLIIIAAQSQTALITILAVSTTAYMFNFFRVSVLAHLGISVGLLCSVIFVVRLSNIINLDYLFNLFVHGLARSSFVKRVEKWNEMITAVQEKPFMWIMGVGKDFHGVKSAATDSDWVFLLTVYGIIPTVVVIIMICYVFIQRFRENSFSAELMFLTVCCGAIISLASAFLFDVKIMMIFILITIVSSSYRYKNA